MTLQPFDVVLMPFPYTDKLSEQRRPTLVVSQPALVEATRQVWVAMITTSRRERLGDVLITDLESAGLPRASRLRASKLATVEADRVIRRMGALTSRDQAAAIGVLRACSAF